ncbi:hypothetical protein Aperf_G00000116427 [Anoplocephala perfoliata]
MQADTWWVGGGLSVRRSRPRVKWAKQADGVRTYIRCCVFKALWIYCHFIITFLMFTCRTFSLSIFTLSLFLFLAESRVVISECPNGTPSCFHGRCLQVTGRDDEGNEWNEQRCFCEPGYHGEACTILVEYNFLHPKITRVRPLRVLSRKVIESPRDLVDEEHEYGGGVQ